MRSLLFLILLSSLNLFSQTAPLEKVRVFIDCQTDCDLDYIKREITYVDYVNDRFQSTVYILATSQRTGSGGRQYFLQTIGQGRFTGMKDTLVYTREPIATDDEVRKLSVESLKLSLLPYLLKTDMAKKLIFSFREEKAGTEEKPKKDPWNFWVYGLRLGGYMSGDKNYSQTNINAGASAGRVTEKLKTNFYLRGNQARNRFGEGTDVFKYTNKQYNFENTTVWSVSKHFSVGGDMNVSKSDYSNYDLNASASAAAEYDFFPYSESSNHYAGFMYKVGPQFLNYIEETIYSKMEELRFQESLSFNVSYNQKWGQVSGSAFFSHYFHDFSKNRLQFSGNADLRLTKGLSFNFYGYYAFQRDQLNIIKGNVTDQDLLTRRRQLNSNYDFFFDFGIRYRFGSLFNNVVNPRFDR